MKPTPPVLAALCRNPGHAIAWCLYGQHPEHRARRLVAGVLAKVGSKDAVPDVELAVNELVANALQHAPGPYELRIIVTSAAVKIAVMDGGDDHADLARRLAHAGVGMPSGGETGRGLQIVSGLFPGSCGAEPTYTCTGIRPAKQVWMTTPRLSAHLVSLQCSAHEL